MVMSDELVAACGSRKHQNISPASSDQPETPITYFSTLPFTAWTETFSMGMCLSCFGGGAAAADAAVVTPDPDTKRRQLAEAAEKRQKETAYRGVKNPETVERKRKKQEEAEKQAMTTSVSGGGGLKWQVG